MAAAGALEPRLACRQEVAMEDGGKPAYFWEFSFKALNIVISLVLHYRTREKGAANNEIKYQNLAIDPRG